MTAVHETLNSFKGLAFVAIAHGSHEHLGLRCPLHQGWVQSTFTQCREGPETQTPKVLAQELVYSVGRSLSIVPQVSVK